ncbi:hypothetical protein [Mycoplasmopsis columboralis]|uniref:Uncharacterized protein n=1 Tax=Mycoplasmopsis columboralis TaxID=171282 RepID=A0A449B5L7_9BACT|nr:hypothetical protein [Mycoplasmopsis columboralis]VEU75901.1 Uncharacterised protein [Mycoplasmopsis columboralis]
MKKSKLLTLDLLSVVFLVIFLLTLPITFVGLTQTKVFEYNALFFFNLISLLIASLSLIWKLMFLQKVTQINLLSFVPFIRYNKYQQAFENKEYYKNTKKDYLLVLVFMLIIAALFTTVSALIISDALNLPITFNDLYTKVNKDQSNKVLPFFAGVFIASEILIIAVAWFSLAYIVYLVWKLVRYNKQHQEA